MQIAEVVLYFAVGQFTVDQVAEVVVVIVAAVVFFKGGCPVYEGRFVELGSIFWGKID